MSSYVKSEKAAPLIGGSYDTAALSERILAFAADVQRKPIAESSGSYMALASKA